MLPVHVQHWFQISIAWLNNNTPPQYIFDAPIGYMATVFTEIIAKLPHVEIAEVYANVNSAMVEFSLRMLSATLPDLLQLTPMNVLRGELQCLSDLTTRYRFVLFSYSGFNGVLLAALLLSGATWCLYNGASSSLSAHTSTTVNRTRLILDGDRPSSDKKRPFPGLSRRRCQGIASSTNELCERYPTQGKKYYLDHAKQALE